MELFYNLFQTVETDLNSGKDECLICPNSTCDTKTQSSPLLNLSESSTSESMVNLIYLIPSYLVFWNCL